MTDGTITPREDVVGGVVLRLGILGMVVAVERVSRRRVELQMPPAALLLERDQPFDRRFGDDRERDALLDIGELAVPRAQRRGAHRAGPLTLWTVHEVVHDERVVAPEQLPEAHRPAFAVEHVVLGNRAAERQRAALRSDALDVPAKLDLFGKQLGARAAIFVVLVGKAQAVPRELARLHEGFSVLGPLHRCVPPAQGRPAPGTSTSTVSIRPLRLASASVGSWVSAVTTKSVRRSAPPSMQA